MEIRRKKGSNFFMADGFAPEGNEKAAPGCRFAYY
jgi:hypothetical protein